MLPKKKQWNKYIKGKQEKKYDSWVIDIVKKHYAIGKKECIGCLELLYQTKEGKFNLKGILELYGTDPKEIQKLKWKLFNTIYQLSNKYKKSIKRKTHPTIMALINQGVFPTKNIPSGFVFVLLRIATDRATKII